MSISLATKGILGKIGDITLITRLNFPLFLSLKNKKYSISLTAKKKILLNLKLYRGNIK